MDNPTLAWAHYYHGLGLHPVPLAPRSKVPPARFPLKRYQTQQPTEVEVFKWFGHPSAHGAPNIALVLGRGVIAVDLDGAGAEEALAEAGVTLPPDAPRSRTSEHSCHVFLSAPHGVGNRVAMLAAAEKRPDNPEKPLWQVDVRGDGGYVVAPPSVHPDGHLYEWEHKIGTDLPAAPRQLLDLIARTGGPGKAPGKAASASAGPGSPDAPKWVSEALQGVGEGRRDDTCARLAGYFLKKGIPADIVRTQLYAFGDRCRPPFPRDQVDKTVLSVQAKEHASQAAATDHQHVEFQVLGYNQGSYFYLPRGGRQVVELRAESHSKLNLMRLAPLQFWESEYAGRQGVQWDMAANALIRQCEAAGVYDTSRVRGRGAWWDVDPATGQGAAVLHVGDALVTAAGRVEIGRLPGGKYVYEAAASIDVDTDSPLSAEEANHLVDVAELISWKRPLSAHLFAGWCAVAPICGALRWRPHIWITAGAGSGKSWVIDEVARKLLHTIGLPVQSDTTEAGLRQTLGHDARPVTFDEIEGEDERAQQRVQSVLALARQASSETGAVIIKGSPLGLAKTYRIRSCFAFSSIGVSVDKHADATRVSVLEIEPFPGTKEERGAHFKKLVDLTAATITEDYARRFIARSIRMAPAIRANAATLAAAGALVIGSQRLGDQAGALLAGTYSLYQDDLLTPAKARAWLEQLDWTEQRDTQEATDEQRCLNRILEHAVRVQTKSYTGDRSVGELIEAASGRREDQLSAADAHAYLLRLGVRVEGDAQGDVFVVASSHSAVARILADTAWSRGWARTLRRLHGAQPTELPVRFAGVRSRGVALPLSLVCGEARAAAAGTSIPAEELFA